MQYRVASDFKEHFNNRELRGLRNLRIFRVETDINNTRFANFMQGIKQIRPPAGVDAMKVERDDENTTYISRKPIR